MTMAGNTKSASTSLVIAAFIAVYIIWGSTYLGISIAIDTIPPLLMAGTRFILAGSLLYAWTRYKGMEAPRGIHWRNAFIVGGLMLFGGNGGVTWSEQYLPSGLAAVLVATVPLWIVVLEWLRPSGHYPGHQIIAGLILGFGGVVVLFGPSNLGGGEGVNLLGAGVIIAATLSWAIGSLYARQAELPSAPLVAVAQEMIGGGVILTVVALLMGEGNQLDISNISLASGLSLLYLTIFGSMVAFTAYIWLLKNVSPARAATYAYVNPVIAVFLGSVFNNESLTLIMVIASTMIIGAVMLITTYRQKLSVQSTENDPLLTNEKQTLTPAIQDI